MKRIILILIFAVLFTGMVFANNIVQVKGVVGVGTDRTSALNDALRQAVSQGKGIFIDSNTRIEMSMTTSDEIVGVINGYLKNYKIINEDEKNGFYKVTIDGSVSLEETPQGKDDLKILMERLGHPEFSVLLSLPTNDRIGFAEDAQSLINEHFVDKGFRTVLKIGDINIKVSIKAKIIKEKKMAGIPYKYVKGNIKLDALTKGTHIIAKCKIPFYKAVRDTDTFFEDNVEGLLLQKLEIFTANIINHLSSVANNGDIITLVIARASTDVKSTIDAIKKISGVKTATIQKTDKQGQLHITISSYVAPENISDALRNQKLRLIRISRNVIYMTQSP